VRAPPDARVRRTVFSLDKDLHGGRQTGMYGPPLCRKRKMKLTGWSAQMYSAFVGAQAPGLDGMRCALVLFSNAALEGFSGLQVSRAPGSTVVSSHSSPADLAASH
jgi:hypothetical protein